MDMRKIKKLIELIQSTGVAEIEIHEGEESVRITREVKMTAAVMQPQIVQTQAVPDVQQTAEVKTATLKQPEKQPEAASQEKHTIKAPMVGTVYLSPTPGTKPYVEIGQPVKVGDVICLIEAMKMFNQIEADKAGILTARLVDNGTPVEFNQPLFVIE